MMILMILASISFLLFFALYVGAGENITETLISCRIEIEEDKIKNLEIQKRLLVETVKANKGEVDKKTRKKAKQLQNKQKASQKMLTAYKKRKLIGLDLIPVAGYHLLKVLKWDIRNKHIKRLYNNCLRFKEQRDAINYTYYVYGNLFGNLFFGLVLSFLSMAIGMGMELGNRAFIIGGSVFILFMIIGYLPLDEVNRIVAKREEEIEKDFLQVVSQLTLLVVAGMEVSRAWLISTKGGKTTLYQEMERVNLDLENNVLPTEAYGKFITRCGNKFATRLATAIIQNMSKGNSEIVSLFTQLNSESWSEYRHSARRMTDKVQAKLFLPTMLMFAGILILVILPVMSGFNL